MPRRSKQPWASAYRAHTCHDALVTCLSREGLEGGSVELTNEGAPPCRVCRANWRRAHAAMKLKVRIRYPGGVWRNDRDPGAIDALFASAQIQGHDEVVDGMRLVAVENQSVLAWAVRARSRVGDPPVFQTEVGDEGPLGPWRATGERLSEFWQAAELWNAAHGRAPVTAFLERRGPLPRLGLRVAWRSPSLTVFTNSAGVHLIEGVDHDVYVFGRKRKPVDQLLARIDCDAVDVEQFSSRRGG